MERGIVAIMAADMVGYSRLIEADETGTLARQKEIFAQTIAPIIETAKGRVVKHMGDGMLVEFASPIDAVRCGVAMQAALKRRAEGVPPEEQQIYRIGINLGDVIHENGDLFGEGVNIAARLEQMAEPGGICISGTVFDHLKSNVEADYAPLGEVQVKNIAQPVRAYRVVPKGSVPVAASRGWQGIAGLATALILVVGVAGWLLWGAANEQAPMMAQSENVSIAVMPFEDRSEAAGQEYFAGGISEDITTDLSRVSGLSVMSPGAMKRFAGSDQSMVDIAEELGVDYVLDGNLRRSGENLRITVRLTGRATGTQVWAERYDRQTAEIFEVQDDIAERVVTRLSASLQRAERMYVPVPEAYDSYIRGRAQRIPPTLPNLKAAQASFERAMAIDPNFAGGYAGAAQLLVLRAEAEGGKAAAKALKQAEEFAQRAVALDPSFGPAWGSLAEVHYRRGDPEAAARDVRKAIAAAPSDSLMRANLGRYLAYMGRASEGVEEIRTAMRMSPDSLPMLFFLGAALRADGQYTAAVEALREHRVRLNDRILPAPTAQYIAALVQAGDLDGARREVALLQEAHPDYSVSRAVWTHRYTDPEEAARFAGVLSEAGMAP